MSKPRRASYAVTSVELPVLKTLGLEEVDPEEVFELQRKEGAGAFGRVFRACYKNDRNRLAALKVIPVALEAGERGEDIESVRREIQFLRECDHPNVVAFHGAYYKDGALWVAMEHCAGGSVGDVRRVRPLNEREISVIMRGALRGLAYLHSRRKIHRDVKGGNILLTASGQVKIADFGVSAQLRDTLSRRGSFVGTPYWMSPELIQDSDYDFKADIWSLGITAIELADQKPPLFDEHPMRVLIQIPRNPPPQVAHPEKWSAAFLDFLRFCLKKDPAERPTALECMQHAFIRREEHIERVFASGEEKEGVAEDVAVEPSATKAVDNVKPDIVAEDEAEVSPASGLGASTAPTDPMAVAIAASTAPATTVEQQIEEEIAEEIGECIDSGDRALSEASHSSKGDDVDEGEASTELLGDTFEFRDSPAQSPLPFPSPSSPNAGASSSADDLMNLSTSASFVLEKDPVGQRPGQEASGKPQQLQLTSTTSFRQPPTEFKLLPASAKSPVIRGSVSKDSSTRFSKLNDGRNTSSSGALALISFAADTQAKRPPRAPSSPSVSRQSALSPPPPTSSVRASRLSTSSPQDDPLASIDTVTSARVNRLLSSFSASTSSPSLAAAMRAYNDQYVVDTPTRSTTRQSFNWRSVEATIPSTKASFHDDVNSSRSSGRIFVGDPFRASHDVCVKYNSIQAQYEGAPLSAEWAALHQQFGIALSHMRCRSSTTPGLHGEDQVPALLRMLRRELVRNGGLRCKYIYRVSPVQEEVQRARAAINRGSFEPAQLSDPHVYASLLKLWLRELPALLLDALDVQDLSAIAKLANSARFSDADDGLSLVTTANIDVVDNQVVQLLRKLGSRENAVLQWLLEHIMEVNAHRASNQMTAQALATVMAPNLFSCVGVARATQDNAANLMREVVAFLCVLLSWRRVSLGSSPATATFLLEQEEKNIASVFPASSDSQTNQMKASAVQERVRQSLGKFGKNAEGGSESEQHCLEMTSLETLLRNRVNQLWTELEASEVTNVETNRQEHILRHVFSNFQLSMLQLIAQYSKRSDECVWANGILDDMKTASQSGLIIPASLGRLNIWVGAALRFEAFCQLLDREQTTQDKLERLQARFGEASTGKNQSKNNQQAARVPDPRFPRCVLHQLTRIHRQQREAESTTMGKNSRAIPSNQGEENGARTTDKLLLDGAVRLASLARVPSKPHHNIAKLGDRQPAIGNLLALVGDSSQNTDRLSLSWLQQQLMASSQSSANLYNKER